jgi:hypothetical protein
VEKTGGNKSAEVKKSITEIRASQIAKLTHPKKDGESGPESEGAAA